MEVTVHIEGRGQSYNTKLEVDPKEPFEKAMRGKTHFWKTFMPRGAPKCLCMIINKGEDDIAVAPDMFQQSFQENEVQHNAQIVLHEYKNLEGPDMDEGGEDEMEEPEDEQNEQAEEEENQDDDKAQDDQKDEKPQVTKVEELEGTQKASEVLFDNDAKSENKQNE